MQVICIHCERTKNANDCWCCIEKGSRYYECKENPDCESLKKKKKEKIDKKVPFTGISLRKMEIEDWVSKKSDSFFSSLVSFFSISSYTKIKNE